MVLCAAYCDKEATLDFLAMEEKPSGRYIGKSVNVQNQHAVEKCYDQTSVCDALIHCFVR